MSRIPERLSPESLARRRKRSKSRQSQFLRGPIPATWLTQAIALPGSALAVGLVVWFKVGCESDSKAIPVCPDLLARFGIKYHTARRGLGHLEQAGLVSVERHSGRCPRVTLKRAGMRGGA